MRRLLLVLVVLLLVVVAARWLATDAPAEAPPGWWRGNTHTHTLWSDGNGAPELVVDWYVEHGYDFLVLSDHNRLSEGERWFPIEAGGRLAPEHVDALRERFGEGAVRVREVDGRAEMRLVPLAELRGRFEAPGEFLLVQGEEITDAYEGKPVHVNGLNLVEVIEPQGGESVVDTIQRNVDAVLEQGRYRERPVLAHLNHPNFRWAITVEELARIRGERFFEVYNGHSGVNNHGDAEHPGTEELWDRALVLRLTELDLGLLYGLATDDSHDYHRWGVGRTNPGRGWVMVRAAALEAGALIEALKRGDFYASSGVTLADFGHDEHELVVDVAAEEGLEYTTRFVGTRRVGDGLGPVGEVLAETTADPAVYRFRGDELYVRAVVVSSREHPNPFAAGDHEQAWVQPVVPPR